ncbi:hypothetical protein T07_11910 [Trichinella nelsoni]|uniref:Uncharacterized protein n=1 Tax=Trichinella nelsoni TaxID=6336 RepID=A0A0V0S076_9BILA|nr:hypothetical protein T07_11910 [Trichinella nelsoni]
MTWYKLQHTLKEESPDKRIARAQAVLERGRNPLIGQSAARKGDVVLLPFMFVGYVGFLVDQEWRSNENRRGSAMTYRPLDRTCLGTSVHSEELWSYTLAFRPRRDGYRTSGHDVAIADLVGTSRNPVMDQSVGRWGSLLGILTGRGESCVDRYLNCGLM